MREARAADVAAYSGLVTQVRVALQQRAEQVLLWQPVAQSYMAEIRGGKLLMAVQPEYASLTVIYETRVENGTVERGRRVVDSGQPDKLQRTALDLATRGVPGGPTFTGEGWTWDRIAEDGSRRMPVPKGELRISRPDAGIATLTHDDDSGVELLAIEGEAALERQALMWWQHRRERPLRVVMNGQEAKLRSLDVPGLIGYHPVTDKSFVALARVGEEFALLLVEGLYVRLAAKVTWNEAIAGNPFNVDELLVMMERGVANHGPAANARAEVPAAGVEIQAGATPDLQRSPVAGVPGPPAACPSGCTPMAEPHRQLCERYFKGLCRRLRGRGARKARELVRLILARIEGCRSDITGTRQEVHRELERLLERALAGGDRNIRDALDLLVKHALFVEREEGTRCTVLFSQLHDPGSEVMRRIAAEMAPATPPPTADASEDHGAAPTGPEPRQEDEEAEPTQAPAMGEVEGTVVVNGVVAAGPSTVLGEDADVPAGVVDVPAVMAPPSASEAVAVVPDASPALDGAADATAPGSEDGDASSSASVHVYQALASKAPVPLVPMGFSIERGEFLRPPDVPLGGFTRPSPTTGEQRDPARDPPSAPGRPMWDRRDESK